MCQLKQIWKLLKIVFFQKQKKSREKTVCVKLFVWPLCDFRDIWYVTNIDTNMWSIRKHFYDMINCVCGILNHAITFCWESICLYMAQGTVYVFLCTVPEVRFPSWAPCPTHLPFRPGDACTCAPLPSSFQQLPCGGPALEHSGQPIRDAKVQPQKVCTNLHIFWQAVMFMFENVLPTTTLCFHFNYPCTPVCE